ncbi:MAG: glycosyltransferase family A protein [Verrucomicrobiota bacterium]
MSRLAVVIPSYNHAHFIEKAIDSCLAQTRKPDRIVIIDDGSKDNSLEVIGRYVERGEVELTAQENAGAHNTINRAIEKAATDCEWISILNSDDHYLPGRFEKCLAHLESNSGKEVICTALNIIDDDDNAIDSTLPRAKWFRAIWSVTRPEDDAEYCDWLGLANFPATTSNVIASTAFLKANPFRPYRYNHDYFFLAKAVLEGKLTLLDEPLVNYRVHATNTITTAPAKLMREMLRQHLDLYAELATRLSAEPALRANFHRYTAALQDNVSAFHAGLFQTLLAQIAHGASEKERESLANSLTDNAFAELERFPNGATISAWDDGDTLAPRAGLAGVITALKEERSKLKEENKAWRALAKARQKLLDSPITGLKRFLGMGKKKFADRGKTPQEKLANLERDSTK